MGRPMPSSTTTQVEIFGEVYSVRGGDENGRLQDLAEHVKGDTARIAILAALNLADELLQTQNRQDGEQVGIREKVVALTEELAHALEGEPGGTRGQLQDMR